MLAVNKRGWGKLTAQKQQAYLTGSQKGREYLAALHYQHWIT
jgi:hypothetical protein